MPEPRDWENLKTVSVKVADWLARIASAADERERQTRDRFNSLADANKADAKNYRAIEAELRKAIARVDGDTHA